MTTRVNTTLGFIALSVALLSLSACQSPTDPDETLDVDDFLEIVATPSVATAVDSTDGRTYRVVRGNNQPDEILTFDWKTSFSITATLNSKADDDDALEFPVKLTGITIVVKQASGGIVTSPTGGETEKYDFVTSATGNQFPGINSSVSVAFDVWYDLPSLKREALVTVNLTFTDNDGVVFSKAHDVRVNP